MHFDPVKPPCAPFCLEGQFVIHSQMNMHMCAKFGANRSSRLVAFRKLVFRLVRLLAAVSAGSRKKHDNKQYLYIENHNSGPNMLT